MNRLAKTFLAVFLPLMPAALAQYNSYTVPKAENRIVIDGRLEESDWKKAPMISSFKGWKTTAEIPETRAWIVQEKEHLVLAMECMEEFPEAMRSSAIHDGMVWQDDHIELFLDSEGARKTCVQILVNSKGVVADGYYSDALNTSTGDWSWESEAEVKTSIGQDRWCLEMRIPFAVLPPFVPGNDWTFHLVRSRYTFSTQHMTSLLGALESFHDILKYDNLCGIARASTGIQTVEQGFGDIAEGDVRSWIKLKNANDRKQDARLVLEVSLGKEILVSRARSLQVSPGEPQRFDIVWPCALDMVGKSICMRLEADGRRIQSFTQQIRSVLPVIGDLKMNAGQFSWSAPAEYVYRLNMSDLDKPLAVYWELWSDDGQTCSLQGRTRVRGNSQCIRVFGTNMRSGVYRLRRFLVDAPSGKVLKGREDRISLVKSPWQE